MHLLLALLAIILVIYSVFKQLKRTRPSLPSLPSLPPWISEKKASIIPAKPQVSQAAILPSKSGPYTLAHDWPRPSIKPNELLIRVRAIGLNPIDWKCVTYGFGVYSLPWVSGRECSGTVEEVGSSVQGFSRGDRVWVCSTNYRDNRTSAFQQYVAAASHNVGHLPNSLTFESGATIGVGTIAASAALFSSLALPRPDPLRRPFPQEVSSQSLSLPSSPSSSSSSTTQKPWLLIWGASSVTGMMAIQLARPTHSILAIASAHNTPYLLSLGASRVLDRHASPSEIIAEAQSLDIKLGIDCVGATTAAHTAHALQRGAKLVCLVKRPEKAVLEESGVEARDIVMKRFHEDERYGRELVEFITKALREGVIGPVRHELIDGGLDGVQKGLDKLKEGGVSGRKLVMKVE